MRPFLKWAGGKYLLINKIRDCLPPGQRLIEPFVGAGAVFLNMDYANYLLADINSDLINCFEYLQKEQQVFIDYTKTFFVPEYNIKSAFLSLRDEFNKTHDLRLKAALFIYLNRHCFNGLMRYNHSGIFNTSFGRYKRPYFPLTAMQHFATKVQDATVVCANYVEIMQNAKAGDLIYCDPPYIPLSKTANFTQYYGGSFTDNDQKNLIDLARDLALRGIPVIISNHDTDYIQKLYFGASITSFPVRRNISCNGDSRMVVREILALFH